jgi:hypothetical protein
MKKKALHPVVLANVGLLPEIPFLRIADWPFRGTTGNVAGVISAPEAAERGDQRKGNRRNPTLAHFSRARNLRIGEPVGRPTDP